MAKRLMILLVALLASGFVGSGCGDDDEDAASENTTTQQATTEEATTSPDTGGGSAATGVPDSPQAKEAVENCKRQTAANTQISGEAKKQIGEVCEEAGSGDADGAVKATREACVIIVEDTAPEGPTKQTALDACKQSTKTP